METGSKKYRGFPKIRDQEKPTSSEPQPIKESVGVQRMAFCKHPGFPINNKAGCVELEKAYQLIKLIEMNKRIDENGSFEYWDRFTVPVRSGTSIVYETQMFKKTFDAKKQEFFKEGLTNSEKILQNQMTKMEEIGKNILTLMQKVKTCLTELDKIALKPRVFTNEDYFNQMIEYEKWGKTQGWTERVKGLEIMLDQAKQISLLSKSENIQDLFPQYQGVIGS